MSKHPERNRTVRANASRRNSQTKSQAVVDLSGLIESDVSKRRLEIFCEKRGLEPDLNSYTAYLRLLTKRERAKILAGWMIMSGGMEFLNIRDLSNRTHFTRPALYAMFDEKAFDEKVKESKESAVIYIYQAILSDFVQTVRSRFGELFDLFDTHLPMQLLSKIFKFIQFAVNERPEYALISFQEICLANEDDRRIVAPAYDLAVTLCRAARKKGELNDYANDFDDHQIIHSLFFSVRSAILGQFGEGQSPENREFLSEDAAYINTLMALKMYASETRANLIEEEIAEVRKKSEEKRNEVKKKAKASL
jgi:hypothetical protein